MSDREWEKFFDLLEKIVEYQGLSFPEKMALVKEKASEQGERAEMSLDEFTAWDWG